MGFALFNRLPTAATLAYGAPLALFTLITVLAWHFTPGTIYGLYSLDDGELCDVSEALALSRALRTHTPEARRV